MTCHLFIGWYRPLDADRCEEPYPDEVPRYGGEGPEEVLPQVGLLQGEVLVRLQAGRHLGQRVGVSLMERLFPKVLILKQERPQSEDSGGLTLFDKD